MAGTLRRRALVWFRADLRLEDNPALNFAAETYDEVFAVYIHSPSEEGEWAPGGASKWWLHHSLTKLSVAIASQGGRLEVVSASSSLKTLEGLVKSREISGVFWNRRYEPLVRERDEKIKKSLRSLGVEAESFNSALLWEPWEISTGEGKPYQVFAPFWNKVSALDTPAKPRPLSKSLKWAKVSAKSDLESLKLLPTLPWAGEFSEHFEPGEEGARASLKKFLKSAADSYKTGRDMPSQNGTSKLSPHLHFGEISPRRVWSEVRAAQEKTSSRDARDNMQVYLKEIAWREFAYHLLFHFSQTPTEPLRQSFKKFPWRKSATELALWQKGLTGYPIVDAGLRELWATGYMHNRVRMIVASFLVKDLRISWLEGAKWFWDTLVDADLASNTLGWQWAGGCGADAAPYFRVFNPTLQGEKFDADGTYVKRWVPELTKLSEKWIHKPWLAPDDVLVKAGISLGKNYPKPMVDHKKARDEALAAFKKIQ